jgi:hypothetical protein
MPRAAAAAGCIAAALPVYAAAAVIAVSRSCQLPVVAAAPAIAAADCRPASCLMLQARMGLQESQQTHGQAIVMVRNSCIRSYRTHMY